MEERLSSVLMMNSGCGLRDSRIGETITNILRSQCDLTSFTTKIVKYDNKELFVVRIAQSSATVYVVKELAHSFERISPTGPQPVTNWNFAEAA